MVERSVILFYLIILFLFWWMFMYLWPYLHVWWMSINYFELFCSDPGQCCVRVYLSCASAERDIHNNITWIRPIFTGGSHKNLAGFHPKISTSLFSHTCTHRWNRLVFTQCYNSTGQDCRHNSDRFRVSRGQILEASCVCSQCLAVLHTLISAVCESKYARLRIPQHGIKHKGQGSYQ